MIPISPVWLGCKGLFKAADLLRECCCQFVKTLRSRLVSSLQVKTNGCVQSGNCQFISPLLLCTPGLTVPIPPIRAVLIYIAPDFRCADLRQALIGPNSRNCKSEFK